MLGQSLYILSVKLLTMQTIEQKIHDCQRWKEAKETLDNFNEMMELIKEYLIKPMEQSPPSPPYTIPGPHMY